MKKLMLVLFFSTLIGDAQMYAQDDDYHEVEAKLLFGPAYINDNLGMSLQNEIIYSFHELFGVGVNLNYTTTYQGLRNETNTYEDLQVVNGYEEIRDQSLYSVGLNGYYTH
ncbi:MAG: hypothetical protein ACQESL_04755 [Bacteroidota bacterium]